MKPNKLINYVYLSAAEAQQLKEYIQKHPDEHIVIRMFSDSPVSIKTTVGINNSNFPGVLFPSKENKDWSTFQQSRLAEFSTETLRAELKRRNTEEKALRQKEFNSAHRCRNCKFFEKESHPFLNSHICMARTWGKTIKRHYVVSGSHGLQCDKFIHK